MSLLIHLASNRFVTFVRSAHPIFRIQYRSQGIDIGKVSNAKYRYNICWYRKKSIDTILISVVSHVPWLAGFIRKQNKNVRKIALVRE